MKGAVPQPSSAAPEPGYSGWDEGGIWFPMSWQALSGGAVQPGLSQFRQLLVGRRFFGQRFLQDLRHLAVARFLGPGDRGAVAYHLVMFDRLRRGGQGGFAHGRIGDVGGDLASIVGRVVVLGV